MLMIHYWYDTWGYVGFAYKETWDRLQVKGDGEETHD